MFETLPSNSKYTIRPVATYRAGFFVCSVPAIESELPGPVDSHFLRGRRPARTSGAAFTFRSIGIPPSVVSSGIGSLAMFRPTPSHEFFIHRVKLWIQ
jgi:hypothetical protein